MQRLTFRLSSSFSNLFQILFCLSLSCWRVFCLFSCFLATVSGYKNNTAATAPNDNLHQKMTAVSNRPLPPWQVYTLSACHLLCRSYLLPPAYRTWLPPGLPIQYTRSWQYTVTKIQFQPFLPPDKSHLFCAQNDKIQVRQKTDGVPSGVFPCHL